MGSGAAKSRENKSRETNSLKERGEEERQCEPVGTWRKRVKRSLLLSTATRRGLAGACLSPPPSPSGDPCFPLFPLSFRRPVPRLSPPPLSFRRPVFPPSSPSPSGVPPYTSFSPFPSKSPLIFSQSLSI